MTFNDIYFFKVPESRVEYRVHQHEGTYDDSSNILGCMYNARFNGRTTRSGSSAEVLSTDNDVTPSHNHINALEKGRPTKFRRPLSHFSSRSENTVDSVLKTVNSAPRGQKTVKNTQLTHRGGRETVYCQEQNLERTMFFFNL